MQLEIEDLVCPLQYAISKQILSILPPFLKQFGSYLQLPINHTVVILSV